MNNQCSKGALLVFTKAPVRGHVKTRLIPSIGRRHATSIYQEILTKTLSTARKSNFSSIQVWVDDRIEHAYFNRLKSRHKVKLYKQKGKDLGERMLNAFNIALRQYPHAVLVGGDCPSLVCSDLITASKYLKNNTDVVLGPAIDGGFYLIGLNKNYAQIFSNIKWGKSRVFADTCENISALGLKLDFLPERWDVDRSVDLLPYFKMKRKNSMLYY